MRLGLFGGTFDPVHNGHIAIASRIRDRLHLDQVWFLPAGQPWMRRSEPISERIHRRTMVELIIRNDSGFALCDVELNRPGDTYTVETLEQLYPTRPGDDWFFIVGSDAAAGFARWKQPARILELATLVVAARPGYHLVDVDALADAVPGARTRVVVVEPALVDVSASHIRQMVGEGASIAGLVPQEVAEYIEAHGLYKSKTRSE